MVDFQNKLRIRQTGHHAKCSVCIRHRLIIKRLGRGPARLGQMKLLKDHLSRQYRDRQVYWSHRAESRSQAVSGAPITSLSMIIDGMDQQKHSYPRGEALSAKEFAGWSRPRLQATTIICHGHCVVTGLSPQNTKSSGSRTIELLAYVLTKPLSHLDFTKVFLRLEADNCSKELKHQTSLRVMASMIATHRLRGCELCFLQSGHSHEDIDSHFALTASFLERHRELWTILDFQKCLQSFLDNKSVRPQEPKREVVVFDSFHDWSLGISLENQIVIWHVLALFPENNWHCYLELNNNPNWQPQHNTSCPGNVTSPISWTTLIWRASVDLVHHTHFVSNGCVMQDSKDWKKNTIWHYHDSWIPGLTRDSLIDKFWRRRNVAQSLSDVVLRTGMLVFQSCVFVLIWTDFLGQSGSCPMRSISQRSFCICQPAKPWRLQWRHHLQANGLMMFNEIIEEL